MQDRVREHQNDTHEQLRKHRRQHVTAHDLPGRGARGARRGKPGLLAQLHDLCSQDTREARPMREGHANRDAHGAAAKRITHEDEQHDVRDAHHEVHEPRHGGVCHTAAECRHAGERKRDDARARRREQTHEHRGGKACKRTGEHVSTHPVRAKGVCGARCEVLGRKVARHGGTRKIPARDHDEREQRAGPHEAGEHESSVAQATPLGRVEHGARTVLAMISAPVTAAGARHACLGPVDRATHGTSPPAHARAGR